MARGYVEALEARQKYGEHALTLAERALLARPEPSPREEDDADE